MTWIKTVPLSEASKELLEALEKYRALYPQEYWTPVQPTSDGTSGIVASHSLIPQALYHAFSTFGALMSPDLSAPNVEKAWYSACGIKLCEATIPEVPSLVG